jgi:hypothetical protein
MVSVSKHRFFGFIPKLIATAQNLLEAYAPGCVHTDWYVEAPMTDQ